MTKRQADVDKLVKHMAGGEILEAFSRAYLRRVPPDYFQAHTLDELDAHLRSVFAFADSRRGDDVAVRVFIPERDSHGYELPGSVLEVAATDVAFLVDSVTNEIEAQGYHVNHVLHPVVGTSRSGDGEITEVLPARSALLRESIQHYELAKRLSNEEAAALQAGIERVLLDVRRVVGDFEPMQGAIYRMIKVARAGSGRYSKDEVDETISFLEWLLDLNFVFLGYREYQIAKEDEGRMLSVVPGSGLGVMRSDEDSAYSTKVLLSDLRPSLRERYEQGDLLVITKTNSTSRVHRRAKMDYIGVRHIAPDGSVVGEARLLGLFTTKAYMAAADSIPVLHRKLQQIIESEDLIEGSHFYKEVVQLFNSFPLDELFASSTEAVSESIVSLVHLQENQQIRLFVRRDLLQRNVSLLVVMPRDRFNATLRKTLQALFMERFGGKSIDYRLALGETDTARLHFTVWVAAGEVPETSIKALEAEVIAAAQTWEERLGEKLAERHGQEVAETLVDKWAGRFPTYYRSSTSLEVAMGDIAMLEDLGRAKQGHAVVGLQNDGQLTRLAVYRADGKLELSAIMPTLEALGLRVVEEVPTRLSGDLDVYIHDFGVLDSSGANLDLATVGSRVSEVVAAVLAGQAESDTLNRLIISAGLDHEQTRILRAYRTYWQRVSPHFTVAYVNDTFAAHPAIAADLVELFQPDSIPIATETMRRDCWRVFMSLSTRWQASTRTGYLRGFVGLIMATQRTNAYRNGMERLVFKFRSAEVPAMPEPAPLYEIYVYANDVEGIHLRGGPVARGGIRWSTRKEDYRTEVLGLMKAQMTKNAVIVPTGAKGGFVLRNPPPDGPDLELVRNGYTTFIRGLLDVTDNLVDGTVVHPDRVRVHDGDDPYLVVAADKGTATFSDTANQIASEYDFWLRDAFASGGSAGYDHKALGITARGGWESVKWHFREIGIDVTADPSRRRHWRHVRRCVRQRHAASPMIKLLAAFDHRHVFIDPTPDPDTSFAERQRLFDLPRSSWADYDESLISSGGGVYPRSAKRIELSDEAMQALDVEARELTPDEVIRAILRSPVDLLWNGGIGTYAKATKESNEQVGDRVNDALRVDGADLRCKVIGEGGNLGLTQLARVEFAENGGKVFADFIDNSGGVHCSDREVNLKILLGLAEARGELATEERDQLIADVVGEVVEAILYDNFLQAQILAQDVERSAFHLEAYEDLMAVLEAEGILDRDIEHLPNNDQMSERATAGLGMSAPELAVLLAYAKRSLRHWLLDSELPDWDDFAGIVGEYFPTEIMCPLRRPCRRTPVASGTDRNRCGQQGRQLGRCDLCHSADGGNGGSA